MVSKPGRFRAMFNQNIPPVSCATMRPNLSLILRSIDDWDDEPTIPNRLIPHDLFDLSDVENDEEYSYNLWLGEHDLAQSIDDWDDEPTIPNRWIIHELFDLSDVETDEEPMPDVVLYV
jgi:hypothetical protein